MLSCRYFRYVGYVIDGDGWLLSITEEGLEEPTAEPVALWSTLNVTKMAVFWAGGWWACRPLFPLKNENVLLRLDDFYPLEWGEPG